MDNRVSACISYLALIIHRYGGKLTLDHLSDFQQDDYDLGVDLKSTKDSVTLTLTKKETGDESWPTQRENGRQP